MYFDIGPEQFTCTGKMLLEAGYTAVMTWQAISQDENMPQFSRGEECSINEVCESLARPLKECLYSPPLGKENVKCITTGGVYLHGNRQNCE